MKNWMAKRASWVLSMATLLASPLVAQADLILISGSTGVNNQTHTATGGTTFTNHADSISSFPASNSLSGPYSSISYDYSQTNGVAHFDGMFAVGVPSVSASSAESWAKGEAFFYEYVTPSTDEQFAWTGSFSESGTADQMGVGAFVYDTDTMTYLTNESASREHSVSSSSSGPGSSLTGLLLAGHTYQIGMHAFLKNYNSNGTVNHVVNTTGGNTGLATGIYHFTATALSGSGSAVTVPEPSSLTLLGLGGIGSLFGAYRRRRIAA